MNNLFSGLTESLADRIESLQKNSLKQQLTKSRILSIKGVTKEAVGAVFGRTRETYRKLTRIEMEEIMNLSESNPTPVIKTAVSKKSSSVKALLNDDERIYREATSLSHLYQRLFSIGRLEYDHLIQRIKEGSPQFFISKNGCTKIRRVYVEELYEVIKGHIQNNTFPERVSWGGGANSRLVSTGGYFD